MIKSPCIVYENVNLKLKLEIETECYFSSFMVRTLIKEKIATVGVGYPATPLTQARIRICLSAAHTKEQLDYALDVIEKVADEIGLKYSRRPRDLTPIDYNRIKIYQDL